VSALLQQIKTAYEVNHMTPQEIAESFDGFDIASVKAALMASSGKFRKDCLGEDEKEAALNFSDDQLAAINQVIFETALAAEHSDGSVDYKTRLAAATYLRDDKKGRKDVMKNAVGNTFNLLQFNQQIQQIRSVADEAKKKAIAA
jgi:hypothetical protein